MVLVKILVDFVMESVVEGDCARVIKIIGYDP